MSDVTSHGTLFGFDAAHFGGIYFNRDTTTGYSYNVVPGGNGKIGPTTQITPSKQTNVGLHGREEIKFTDYLTGIAGLGAEYTNVNGTLNNFDFPGVFIPKVTATPANNNYYNIAPEGALVYRPNSDWLIKARIGTGYGTPQAGDLFPGNNTQLKSQTNLGYDLAAIWTPLDTVRLSVDGFYEFFRNELVTQTTAPTPERPRANGFYLQRAAFRTSRRRGRGRMALLSGMEGEGRLHL